MALILRIDFLAPARHAAWTTRPAWRWRLQHLAGLTQLLGVENQMHTGNLVWINTEQPFDAFEVHAPGLYEGRA